MREMKWKEDLVRKKRERRKRRTERKKRKETKKEIKGITLNEKGLNKGGREIE
jgi:hypothetical protein